MDEARALPPSKVQSSLFVGLRQSTGQPLPAERIDSVAKRVAGLLGASSCKVHQDRETGRLKGSAHLHFSSSHAAINACEQVAKRGAELMPGVTVRTTLQREVTLQERQNRRDEPTRLAVAKSLFASFVDRVCAYNAPIALGLATFGSSHEIVCPLTTLVLDFITKVNSVQTAGDQTVRRLPSLS